MTAPAYLSTRPGHGTFISTKNAVTVVEGAPVLVSTQLALGAVLQDAAKHGIPLDVSTSATGYPKTGH